MNPRRTGPAVYPAMIEAALELVRTWEARWGERPAPLPVDADRWAAAWEEFERRMGGNFPFFHPRYAGQMLKPPHPAAVAGYVAAMLINPNNHALDASPVTSAMEVEAVERLAAMLGLAAHLGHLTSSGTIANLEALWVARELHPDKGVVFGANAHYTHARMCQVLRMPARAVPADVDGRIDLDALEAELRPGRRRDRRRSRAARPALGAIDRIDEALALSERHGVRIHVDAAYGGFFVLLDDAPAPLRAIGARRLRRHRPAQARPPALRLRRGAVRRPRRRAPVRARLAVHLLHVRRAAPG